MAHSHAALFFKIAPTCLLSRIVGCAARIPLPRPVMRRFIAWYSAKYGVRNEYEEPPGGFRTIDSFFTRRLRQGARRIDRTRLAVISPVDARIEQRGTIEGDTVIIAKGIGYGIDELIPASTARRFHGGSFVTLYLAPGDYHRIHSPVEGVITGYLNVPGRLLTVQPWLVDRIPRLYAINERIITYLETTAGSIAVCKIGAFNVGRITLSYCAERTNRAFRRLREVVFPADAGIPVAAGEEIGVFHLGSTVILIFEKDRVTLDDIPLGTQVRMGARIGSLRER